MLYEIPAQSEEVYSSWPEGVGYIKARLPNGESAPIPVLNRTNMLVFGTTGSGKTTSFVIPVVDRLLSANPTTMGVFFETKCTFLDRFLGVYDKVIVHSSTDIPEKNLFRWNLVQEIRQADDAESEAKQIADFLFHDLLKGANNNLAWVESARNLFLAVLRTIVDCFPDNTSNHVLVEALRRMSVEEILRYVSRHPRNHAVVRDFGFDVKKSGTYKPTRRAGDVMFFFNQVIERFSGNFASDGCDTIHNYLHGKYGRNLFLLHDLAKAEISRPFLSYFLYKIKSDKMSLFSDIKETPVLWCMDEADKLAESGKCADFGIYQTCTLGREYGMQVLLSTQSIENLYGLASGFNEHVTRGGVAGFPVICAFNVAESSTTSELQSLFGTKRKEIYTRAASRYDSPTLKSEIEPIVTGEDLVFLDTGECFIKVKNHEPVKVKILLDQDHGGA